MKRERRGLRKKIKNDQATGRLTVLLLSVLLLTGVYTLESKEAIRVQISF